MKLRRCLVSVAVTAAIAPAALFAVTPAFADSATPSVTATTAAPTTSETPAPTATATTAPSTTSETPAPTATPTTTPTTTPTVTRTATPTVTPTATTPPPASPGDGTPCEDNDEGPEVDSNLTTDFTGLASKVAAGSGWHPFTMNVKNTSGTDYRRVDFGVFAAVFKSNGDDETRHLKLQFQDPSTGTWTTISENEIDPDAGYLGYTDVQAHAAFSIKLRLAVDASAPAGMGFTIGVGIYADDQGNCVVFGSDAYQFDVVPAGTTGSNGNASPATGGTKPLPPKPAGDNKINPQADLAETGSSSALPAIAATGAIVLVAGVGLTFLLRRRNGTHTAA